MATLQSPRAIYLRGVVACQKCAAPIHVHKLKSLANEFSLLCSRCGHRGHYLNRDITIERLPERRRKPARAMSSSRDVFHRGSRNLN